MFLVKLNNKISVHENKWVACARLKGLPETKRSFRDTDPESPTRGNLIIPPEVESYELAQEAIEQYNKYVEAQGLDVNDLVYNAETGLFEEPTEEDLQKVHDRQTEEQIRAQCVRLLELSDGKMVWDTKEADLKKWKAWRQKLREIIKKPLMHVDEEIPAAPFPVAWDPKGGSFEAQS